MKLTVFTQKQIETYNYSSNQRKKQVQKKKKHEKRSFGKDSAAI